MWLALIRGTRYSLRRYNRRVAQPTKLRLGYPGETIVFTKITLTEASNSCGIRLSTLTAKLITPKEKSSLAGPGAYPERQRARLHLDSVCAGKASNTQSESRSRKGPTLSVSLVKLYCTRIGP